jgi:hypothetical protein
LDGIILKYVYFMRVYKESITASFKIFLIYHSQFSVKLGAEKLPLNNQRNTEYKNNLEQCTVVSVVSGSGR